MKLCEIVHRERCTLSLSLEIQHYSLLFCTLGLLFIITSPHRHLTQPNVNGVSIPADDRIRRVPSARTQTFFAHTKIKKCATFVPSDFPRTRTHTKTSSKSYDVERDFLLIIFPKDKRLRWDFALLGRRR